MKIYRVYLPAETSDGATDHYEGTLTAAHKWAKANIGKHTWTDVVIEERELETDKAAIVEALNGVPRFVGAPNAKVWGLTVRGGLEEVKD